MDNKRPIFTLVYFTAKWNPACAEIEADYERLTAEKASFHHIRVDCDETPKLKRYFDARIEPSFLVLVNGGEIDRMSHYNFGKLSTQLERIQALHADGMGYYGDSKHTWERFYDEFDKWSKYGENDRDAFRARLDSNSDTWRGAGTNTV